MKVSAVASHPIQYQAPVWRALAAVDGLELTVHFLSDHGVRSTWDPGFKASFSWDIDTTRGFDHEFLSTTDSQPIRRPVEAFIRSFRAAKAEAVLISGYTATGYVGASLAAAARKTPLYMRAETIADSDCFRSPRSPAIPATRLLVRQLKGAFAIGRSSAQWYVERGMPPENVVTLGYGIENARFGDVDPTEVDVYRRRFAEPGQPVVLFAGKLTPRKQPLFAAQVFEELRRSLPDAVLVIAGSGELESALEACSDRNVVRLGFVNQSELPMVYRAADVTLVPSAFETWGLVVNESLAAGTPVIASGAVPSAVEFVHNGSEAVRVLEIEAQLWADAARSLVETDRSHLETAARATVVGYDAGATGTAIGDYLVARHGRRV